MAKKPSHLIYGLEDKPPLWVTLTLGLQHIFPMTSTLILPVIIVKEIGGGPELAENVIKMCMIAGGIATILQALNKGPVGSGYLCPYLSGPAYISASLLAAKTGGLSLLFGMTIISGVFEALLSGVMHRLRALFPAEVIGLVVTMVGIELIPLGVSNFFGIEGAASMPKVHEVVVAFITLTIMVGLNVWGKGKWRLYCVVIGMAVGYLVSYISGILTVSDIKLLTRAPLVSFPDVGHTHWSFAWTMLSPFLLASLASTLKAAGDITTCQKINDVEWKRPDMKSIGRGILASSLGTVLAALLGGIAQSTSSSNVGVSIATGATSRRIAFAAGGLFTLLAFFPILSAFFTIMPRPVIGALLIFVTCFMVLAGIQIMMSRLIDARKTFVIGISLILGLSVDIAPGLYKNIIHPWLHPLFSSSLTLATTSVVILNLIFRIGIAKRKTLELEPGVDSSEKIFNFMETQGATWGARKEVVYRATSAINEIFESVTSGGIVKGKIKADVSFDEFNLDIDIRYDGTPVEITKELPEEADWLGNEKSIAKLSGFLISHYVDRVKFNIKDDRCHVQLHFDH